MKALEKPVTARRRIGTIEWRRDHYRVRISLPNGARVSFALKAGLSEAEARARATELGERARHIGKSMEIKSGRGT